MKKPYLLAPGPTPIPTETLLAMARPIIHHRHPEYEALFAEVRDGLRYVFQTEEEVLVFAASGTGGMEAAVTNTLSPGDKVLVVKGGRFGERWAEILEAYGVKVIPLEVEWGKAVEPERVASALQQDPSIKGVFATHSETSTGVLHDIKAIAEVVRKTPAILVVDAITSLGVTDLRTDEWGLDVVVAGSQKALMLPPGLAFCSVSAEAWGFVERSTLPKYYFSFVETKKSQERNQSPFTPAISLIVALRESLRLIKEEGLKTIFARHERLAKATRRGIQALGLEFFAERPSPALTAVKVPYGISGGEIIRALRERHGVTIAGGQGTLKDRIFRIAHLGYADFSDVIVALSALELTLAGLGVPVKIGDGVRAAQEVLGQRPETIEGG